MKVLINLIFFIPGNSFPLHIKSHAQVEYKNSFLVIGGNGGLFSGSNTNLNQIYEYSIDNGNWTLWSTILASQDTGHVSALIITTEKCFNCGSGEWLNLCNLMSTLV